MKRPGILVLIVSFALLAIWLTSKVKKTPNQAEDSKNQQKESINLPGPPPRFVVDPHLFLENYGSETKKPQDDLEFLHSLISDCQLVFKNFDSFYLPENKEITDFLRGKNPDHLAWIPDNHRFLNEKGEILDRWLSPIFFHKQSGFSFQLRSAGEDRTLWTDDDIVK